MKDSFSNYNRTVIDLTGTVDKTKITGHTRRLAYLFDVNLYKQIYVDFTGIRPQDPVSHKPLDLFPERSSDYLKLLPDKVYIPEDEKGSLFVLVRNDPRKPGEKKYNIILAIRKELQSEFEETVTKIQQFFQLRRNHK